jgi:hypothetical protein
MFPQIQKKTSRKDAREAVAIFDFGSGYCVWTHGSVKASGRRWKKPG